MNFDRKLILFSCLLLAACSAQQYYSCPISCNISNTTLLNNHQDCQCGSTAPPLGRDAPKSDLPQFIHITFDDAITPPMWEYYQSFLLNNTLTDARGCTPRATFYISTQYTNFHSATKLYAGGHEIGVHTITHTTGSSTSVSTWRTEIHKARAIISSMGKIPLEEIVGFRAPFLAYNNNMYKVLLEEGFLYDNSWPDDYNTGGTSKAAGLNYPYTFDYRSPQPAQTGEALNQGYPGLWEIPMGTLHNADLSPFSSMDPPASGTALFNLFQRNFDWLYASNRAPFGLYFHAAWILGDPTRLTTLQQFLTYAASKPNVFFVTSKQMISYMRNPVPASQIHLDPEFDCPAPISVAVSEVCDGIDNDLDGSVDEGVLNYCGYGSDNFYSCATCPPTYPYLSSTLEGYIPSCGNGICQSSSGETCTSCPSDCACVTTAAPSLTTSALPSDCVAGCGVAACGPDNGNGVVTVDSVWTGGMCGTIKAHNPSLTETTTDWAVIMKFSTPLTIGSSWGFAWDSCGDGQTFLVTPNSGSKIIAPNAWDKNAGFCGNFAGSNISVVARAFIYLPSGVVQPVPVKGSQTTGSLTTGAVNVDASTSSSLTTGTIDSSTTGASVDPSTSDSSTTGLPTLATSDDATTQAAIVTTQSATTQAAVVTTRSATTSRATSQSATTSRSTTSKIATTQAASIATTQAASIATTQAASTSSTSGNSNTCVCSVCDDGNSNFTVTSSSSTGLCGTITISNPT